MRAYRRFIWYLYCIMYLCLSSEHRSTDDKHPLLFPAHPLNDLIRALRQRSSTRIRWRNGIQFEQRRAPCQRYARCVRLMMDLERRGLVVYVCVEFVVKVKKSVQRTISVQLVRCN